LPRAQSAWTRAARRSSTSRPDGKRRWCSPKRRSASAGLLARSALAAFDRMATSSDNRSLGGVSFAGRGAAVSSVRGAAGSARAAGAEATSALRGSATTGALALRGAGSSGVGPRRAQLAPSPAIETPTTRPESFCQASQRPAVAAAPGEANSAVSPRRDARADATRDLSSSEGLSTECPSRISARATSLSSLMWPFPSVAQRDVTEQARRLASPPATLSRQCSLGCRAPPRFPAP
jgi:hypothetical protein